MIEVNPHAVAPPPLDIKAAMASLAKYWPTSEKIDVFSAKLAQARRKTRSFSSGWARCFFISPNGR